MSLAANDFNVWYGGRDCPGLEQPAELTYPAQAQGAFGVTLYHPGPRQALPSDHGFHGVMLPIGVPTSGPASSLGTGWGDVKKAGTQYGTPAETRGDRLGAPPAEQCMRNFSVYHLASRDFGTTLLDPPTTHTSSILLRRAAASSLLVPPMVPLL